MNNQLKPGDRIGVYEVLTYGRYGKEIMPIGSHRIGRIDRYGMIQILSEHKIHNWLPMDTSDCGFGIEAKLVGFLRITKVK